MTKKTKLFQFRIEYELLTGLDILAHINHMNRSQIIRLLIMNELKKEQLITTKFIETKPGYIDKNGDIEFSKGYNKIILKAKKVNDEIRLL